MKPLYKEVNYIGEELYISSLSTNLAFFTRLNYIHIDFIKWATSQATPFFYLTSSWHDDPQPQHLFFDPPHYDSQLQQFVYWSFLEHKLQPDNKRSDFSELHKPWIQWLLIKESDFWPFLKDHFHV